MQVFKSWLEEEIVKEGDGRWRAQHMQLKEGSAERRKKVTVGNADVVF